MIPVDVLLPAAGDRHPFQTQGEGNRMTMNVRKEHWKRKKGIQTHQKRMKKKNILLVRPAAVVVAADSDVHFESQYHSIFPLSA
jgi:hypothetical protein